MQVNTNNLVSITDANQNFSRVARLVDENGVAVILKNNVPRYVLMEYSQMLKEEPADNAMVQEVGESIIKRHLEAFKVLAK
ncbi:MAG: type II toxin-antitoxin system Phd/YefM family antitoxin [Lachnospiraceae bacterium]|nr:type II toxin-antitoxin system Phd/YefM family antitoxin [Lachnospiraceae bacterium]